MSTNAHVHMHAADPPLHRMLGWYQWDVLIGLIEQILQQQKSTHSSIIGGVLFYQEILWISDVWEKQMGKYRLNWLIWAAFGNGDMHIHNPLQI